MIRQNLPYKILALAIAVVIWLYVNEFQASNDTQNRKNPFVTASFSVPLKVRKIASNLTVTEIPEEVKVTIEGRPDDITALTAQQDEISAYIYAHDQTAGIHRFPVIVRLPDGFPTVRKSAEPVAVDVSLSEKQRRDMGIQPLFVGIVPDSYRFAQPSIVPANATIYGAPKSVEAVDKLVVKVNAEKLSDIGADTNFTVVPINSSGKQIKGVEISPQMVHVRLGPMAGPSKRAVFVNVATYGQVSYPYKVTSIEVQPQTVIASGKASELAGLEMLSTEPLLMSGRKQNFTQRLNLVLPQGIVLLGGKHVDVTVKISENPSADGKLTP